MERLTILTADSLYAALALGRMGVISTITTVVGVIVPVIVELSSSEPTGATLWRPRDGTHRGNASSRLASFAPSWCTVVVKREERSTVR